MPMRQLTSAPVVCPPALYMQPAMICCPGATATPPPLGTPVCGGVVVVLLTRSDEPEPGASIMQAVPWYHTDVVRDHPLPSVQSVSEAVSKSPLVIGAFCTGGDAVGRTT